MISRSLGILTLSQPITFWKNEKSSLEIRIQLCVQSGHNEFTDWLQNTFRRIFWLSFYSAVTNLVFEASRQLKDTKKVSFEIQLCFN